MAGSAGFSSSLIQRMASRFHAATFPSSRRPILQFPSGQNGGRSKPQWGKYPKFAIARCSSATSPSLLTLSSGMRAGIQDAISTCSSGSSTSTWVMSPREMSTCFHVEKSPVQSEEAEIAIVLGIRVKVAVPSGPVVRISSRHTLSPHCSVFRTLALLTGKPSRSVTVTMTVPPPPSSSPHPPARSSSARLHPASHRRTRPGRTLVPGAKAPDSLSMLHCIAPSPPGSLPGRKRCMRTAPAS